MRYMPALASCIASLVLVGCGDSEQTVRWEDEVVLNTGETIIVHREQVYRRGGEPGNPFKSGWMARIPGTVTFTWRQQEYTFSEHSVPLVLAISPEGRPVFVADASTGSWDLRNAYPCTTPYYVQFIPDQTARRWSWPKSVEPWLYGLRSNLWTDIPRPGEPAQRHSAQEILARNESLRLLRYRAIVPDHVGEQCRGKTPGSGDTR